MSSKDRSETGSGVGSGPASSTASKKSKASNSGSSDAIKVVCRFRPPRAPVKEPIVSKNGKHTYNPDQFKLNDATGEVHYVSDFQDGKHFAFDKVYGGDSTQAQVFSEISDSVDFVMDGFNGAVLAYGQTSAGKSFTMEGPSIWDKEYQGVVPRSVAKLFEEIEKAPATIQFQIIVSYYEIYCEKVRDLLNPMQTNMKVRETKTEGFIVQDVTEVYCTDKESVLRVIEMGKTNRIAAPTLMNAESSRSHSIFSILVDQQDTASGRHKRGVLYLVDLAGSEKVGKTGAKGMRLEEAKNINSSLTSLGMVINALCDKAPHVPYRDSKLTMLLMEALGGNSKTTLIICCTPEPDHSPETLSTLRFGERAKRIQTHAKVNEELSPAELKAHLTAAKKELAQLVGVLGRTSQTVGEAVSSSSVAPLVPLVDVLKKALAKSSAAGAGAKGGDAAASAEAGDILPESGTPRSVPAALGSAAGDDSSVGSASRDSAKGRERDKETEEQVADLTQRMAALEEEVELEKLKSAQAHEKCVFKDTEVAALQATIAELEERLVKANLQAKRAQEAKAAAEELLSEANANIAAQQQQREQERGRSLSDSRDTSGFSVPDTTPQNRHRQSWVDVPTPAHSHSGEAVSPVQPTSIKEVFTPDSEQESSIFSPGSPLANGDELKGLTARESREFLLKLERELIASGLSPSPPKTHHPSRGAGGAGGKGQPQGEGGSAKDKDDGNEALRFLDIKDSDIAATPASPAVDAEGNSAYSRDAYEAHVRRLMSILEQEQQARLRVEDKLEEARKQLLRQSAKVITGPSGSSASKGKGFLHNLFGGLGSSPAPAQQSGGTLTQISNLVSDTFSPGTRRLSGGISSGAGAGAPEDLNNKWTGYTEREAALAETLEIAQERIMELVTEMESNQEANTIVLETKESVLRSLARQNTHLAMERDTLTQKVEELTSKTEQLSTLLRSLQQAQVHVQPVQPTLPGPGGVGAQSFRIAGPGGLQRFNSNIRVMGSLGGEGEVVGVTPKGFNMKSNPSFRMGGKPPIPLTAAPIAVTGGASPQQGIQSPSAGDPPSAAGIASPPAASTVVIPPPVIPAGGAAALTARTPFFFSGTGAIQRNRNSSTGTSRSSPYPPSSASPVNDSQSTSLSSSPDTSYNDLTVLARAASPQGAFPKDAVAKDADAADGNGNEPNTSTADSDTTAEDQKALGGIAEGPEETE